MLADRRAFIVAAGSSRHNAQPADPTVQPAPGTPAPTPAPTPVEEAASPPAAPPVASPPPATQSAPVVNTRASGLEPVDREAAEAPAGTRPATARSRPDRAARAAARAETRRAAPAPSVRSEAPAAVAAPVAAASAPAAAPAPVAEAPPAAAPAPAEPAPAAAAEPAAPTEARQAGNSLWPWLLGAALVIGALLLFARRRRRAADEQVHYDEPVAYQEPVDQEPVAAAAPVAAAPLAAEAGRPWLDLMIRPVRAGVGEEAARVEFELGVENSGSAPARDVRIATFMLPAAEASEMERMLIEGGAAPARTAAELAPGEATRIETAVALPRERLSDAILPVVVADARYTLPDGSEGRTAASFAVGVPREEGDFFQFDVDNPSGLHEGVEARLVGAPHRD